MLYMKEELMANELFPVKSVVRLWLDSQKKYSNHMRKHKSGVAKAKAPRNLKQMTLNNIPNVDLNSVYLGDLLVMPLDPLT